MPFLQEEICVLHHDVANLGHLMPPKTPHVGDRYRFETELRLASGVSHVDVRRLSPLHAEEEEPLPTDSQQSGHTYESTAAGS
jgi:hypothetical protein